MDIPTRSAPLIAQVVRRAMADMTPQAPQS
jgi:hypothetical protein